MCLNNEEWSLNRLTVNIQNSIIVNRSAFRQNSISATIDRGVKWNCKNHCIGNPQCTSFGGLLRNNADLFISGFSGHIADCSNILLAELQAIYQGFSMVRALGISNFVCYSDSLHSVSLINGPPQNFHALPKPNNSSNKINVKVINPKIC
jgi:ribonuclease HI